MRAKNRASGFFVSRFSSRQAGQEAKKEQINKTRASVYNFGVFGCTHPLWGWILTTNLSFFLKII